MQNIRFYLLIFFCISNIGLKGQDLLFSQYYNNPLFSNPAMTGIYNGKYRVGFAYRNQYFKISPDSRFSLKDFFFDTRINIINNDYLSFGVMITDEDFGTARLGKSLGYLSVSYSKLLNYDKYRSVSHYLVFGSQFGYGKFYPDGGDYLFGIQFDKSTQSLDRNISNGEVSVNYKSFPDINIGIMWYASGRNNSVYIGFSGSHLNRPDISLLSRSSEQMNIRLLALFGGQVMILEQIDLLPSVTINMQSGVFNALLGSQIQVKNDGDNANAIRFGAFIRSTNSFYKTVVSDVIISSIFEIKEITLGFSYDINISSIRKTTGMNGAFELTGIYVWGNNPERKHLNCPTF